MKEPIEELFKQSLGGHEMPYNPDAWKAMSARLDVVSPVAAPTSYLKYYLGAAGIGVAAVATYFFLAGGNTTDTSVNPIAKETTTEQTSKKSVNSSATNGQKQSENTTESANSSETLSSAENGIQNMTITQSNSTINTQGQTASNQELNEKPLHVAPAPSNSSANVGHSNNGSNSTSPAASNTTTQQKMAMPAVSDLCLNEEITITNTNGKEIYVLDGLNNVVKTIPANKTVVFNPTIVGNYSLGYRNDSEMESTSYFQVNRIPDADFTVDLINKFENGLPSTHVNGIGGQGTYIWNAKDQVSTGVETDMHFYKKGEQTIELTVNNGQCATSVEKTIYIENDYNLMAVTGFTPMSNDPKNNTFMPFALTERDVNFVLTIIDGRDGGIVYQTSDASLPWDGTDIRSGRRSETPQVYVWKAQIINPAANEPSEYVGTITMN